MWRWTALVVLAVLHKNISSQPITDNSSDDTPTAHLDLEESCSCEDLEKSIIRRDVRYDDAIDASSRDVDDCSCRFRYTDSQGASSLLFPTAMRSAGTDLRPGDKKEPKPLFNPEVDLASSVLEQLRVATDEEYQEALARDAAKSAGRAVEDVVFEDATPQESANMVTIVVNPKAADSDNVIPQASNIKQSRCVNPLQRASSPSLSDRLKLSKKRPYYKNLQDLDSEVGASMIEEQKISVKSPLENNNLKSIVTSNDIEDNCNVPDLRSTSEDPYQNKFEKYDKTSSSLLQSIKDRIRPLSRIPKFKLQRSESATTTNDLSPAPSTIYEQATKKVPYERTKSHLEDIKQQNRPFSITNLLNLKDVELIPLKDLFSKQAKTSNSLKSGKLLPSMFEQDHGEISNESETEVAEDWQNTRPTLRNDPLDKVITKPRSTSSIINLKRTPVETSIYRDNCNNEKESIELNREVHRNDYNKPTEVLSSILQYDDGEFSIENDEQDSDSGTTLYTEINESTTDSINDPEPSPSHINFEIGPKETLNINDGCDSVGLTKEADTEIGEGKPRSTEILDTIPVLNDALPKATFDNSNDCVGNNNRQDLITDASNTVSNTIDQLETRSSEIQNVEPDYFKPNNIEGDDESKMTKEPRPKLLDPIAIDKTISNIKSYILKKKEDLNKIKTSIKNRNIPNQESEDNSVTRNINEDCTNEASVLISTVNSIDLNDNFEVFTTTKLDLADDRLENTSTTPLPNVSNDYTQDTCVSAEISMQDLQQLSDSILQQEERQLTNVECNKSSNEEELDSSQKNSEGSDFLDSDSSASTPNQAVVEPENFDNMQDESEGINAACNTDFPSQIDVNAQASEMNISTIPKASETLGMHSTFNQPITPTLDLFKNSLKDINDVLKLPPLDPLKEKIAKFFDKNERNTEDIFPVAVKSKPLNILNSFKTTDLNSPNFPVQTPFLRLSEDHDFDHLEETRKSSSLPNMPNVDPQSYKSESSVSRGLQGKPVNLKSALEDNKVSEKYLKASNNLNDHLNPLNDLRSQLTDSSVEASNNIYSSLRNTQNAVESKLRQLKNNNMNLLKTPIQSSSSLLDTLTQNHEDMNDKLRSLHVDFNDRVESMRNDLIDSSKRLTSGYGGPKPSLKSPNIFNKPGYENINHKLRALHMDFSDRIESMRNDIIDRSKPLTDVWRGTKSNLRSSSNFNKQNKPNKPLKKTWKASNTREPQLSSTRKQMPSRTSLASKTLDLKKLRMPAAASVPVPRTVQIPELKTTSSKLPPSLRKVSLNNDRNLNEDVSRSFGGQASTLQLPSTLRNRINLKKENTVTVSFSTTPRPEKLNIPNFRSTIPQNTAKGRTNFETRPIYEDRNRSPSILKKSKTSVLNYDQPNKYRYSNREVNEKLLTNPIGLKEKSQLKVSETALQSWPKASESAFLSKVKDAVRERLSYLNSAKALKQSMQGDKAKDMRELSVLKSDMTRSASENKEIVHKQMLKENVSYNCKMTCTKD
ncbi:unnamed protein product [Arctia plantaginis]|uniref:Uncharacterized protein n=1 Tax=Arctia plantaginis TaxID=874455 RepID=A0A8S1AFS6_ARCPL|nr:unnamed protein product [Arctia plantaginis]